MACNHLFTCLNLVNLIEARLQHLQLTVSSSSHTPNSCGCVFSALPKLVRFHHDRYSMESYTQLYMLKQCICCLCVMVLSCFCAIFTVTDTAVYQTKRSKHQNRTNLKHQLWPDGRVGVHASTHSEYI